MSDKRGVTIDFLLRRTGARVRMHERRFRFATPDGHIDTVPLGYAVATGIISFTDLARALRGGAIPVKEEEGEE